MVLITGGTGFLGSILIKQLLAKGYTNIRAIKRSTSSFQYLEAEKDKIEWVEADVLDFPALEDAFEGVTQVYHCAAVISFSPKKREFMHKINVEGTTNIVDLCLDKKVEKLVHVSSIAALGRSEETNNVNEKTEWDEKSSLNSEYAKSKQRSEMEVWRGNAEGLTVAIVNPAIILGPIDWEEGTGKFFTSVQKGFPYFTKGSSGFVDVEDVARSMLLLMESDISGERFILSGANKSYRDLLNSIADALGKPKPTKEVGAFLSGLIWRLEAIKSMFSNKEPLLTKETSQNALHTYNYDNSKIKEALNFKFTPFEATIERTAKAFLQKQ